MTSHRLPSEMETTTIQDPFNSPVESVPQSPLKPQPVLQKKYRYDSQSTDASDLYLSETADAAYYNASTHKEKSGSMSSEEKWLSPAQTTESHHKQSPRNSSPQKHYGVVSDLEKGLGGQRRSRDRSSRSSRTRAQRAHEEDLEAAREMQESHSLRILLFLSMPVVALSFLNALWTLVSLLITLLSQPVRMCARRPSFGQQLGGLLGPTLNLQLKCIYTPLPPYANEDSSYHPCMLLAVQLLSPFLSMGVMLAAWVVAVFWISSLVVGDPAGTDRRDDGTDTVLMLRRSWEKWLCRAIRHD